MKHAPFPDGVVLEIRQLIEMEDLGPALTPELRERDKRCMELAARNAKQK